MGGSSPSPAPTNQTVTQVQQIPQYVQDESQSNMDYANSLAANPAPIYGAPIVAGLNDTEMAGINQGVNNAYSYAPYMNVAQTQSAQAAGMNPIWEGDTTNMASFGAGNVVQQVGGLNNSVGMGDALAYNSVGNAANLVNNASNYGGNAVAQTNSMLGNGSNYASGAVSGTNALVGAGGSMATGNYANTANAVNALNPASQQVINSYMNPYVQASLAPQLMQAQLLQNQQQAGINAQATGANAFGDSRQGTQNAMQNYYGQQTNAGIVAQGYNTAYTNALQTALAEQGQQQQLGQLGEAAANTLMNGAGITGQVGLGAANAANQGAATAGQIGLGAANAANTSAQVESQAGINAANTYMTGAGQQNAAANTLLNQQTAEQNYQKLLQAQQAQEQNMATQNAALGTTNQTNALNAANAIYNSGNLVQQNDQNALTAAYQQWSNQVNWPYQMLNVRESTINSNPYQIANANTVPAPNSGQQSFATLASTLGLLGGAGSKQ